MEVKLTKEQVQEFEATHKRVAHLRGKDGDWEVVIRKPTRAEYKQFRSRTHNPAQVADAQEILARQCVVYPSRDAFDAMLEDWPGIPEAAGAAFGRLMGLAAEEDGK